MLVFKLGCYKFKTLIIIPNITTRNQKVNKKGKNKETKMELHKHSTKDFKNGQELRNKKYVRYTEGKKLNSRSESFLISNYFKHIWIELFIKSQRLADWIFKRLKCLWIKMLSYRRLSSRPTGRSSRTPRCGGSQGQG